MTLIAAVVVVKEWRHTAAFRLVVAQKWRRRCCAVKRFKKSRKATILLQACCRLRWKIGDVNLVQEESGEEVWVCGCLTCHLSRFAVHPREFAKCAELQERLGGIQAALKQKGGAPQADEGHAQGQQGGAGMSRDELDVRLLETQLRLTDAEQSQQFTLCAQLQEALQALEVLREQYPTEDELRGKIGQVKASVDAAMTRKDFRLCTELQSKLEDLEGKLAKVAAAPGDQVTHEVCRADLEADLVERQKALQEAQNNKKFDLCVELQQAITDATAALEALPSVESIDAEILAGEQALLAAKEAKDFRVVAEWTIAIPKLQRKRKLMESDKYAQLSRPEVLEKIKGFSDEMASAVEAKNFQLCSGIQKELDQLEAILKTMPSAEELDLQIKEADAQLEAAMNTKDFAKCGELNRTLEKLRSDRAAMPDPEPKPAPEPEPVAAAPKPEPMAAPKPKLQSKATVARLIPPKAPGAGLKVSRSPYNLSLLLLEALAETPKPDLSPNVNPIYQSRREALTCTDPVSHTSTPLLVGVKAGRPGGSIASSVVSLPGSIAKRDGRPVSKLRVKRPVTALSHSSIAEVTKAMSLAKSDSALLLGADGALEGIVTDNDLTRRVVAKGVDTSEQVSSIMTPNPTCVSMEDSAVEALGIMVEKHFRHLPVTTAEGGVAGVLDIAKCLYDAISRLEKVATKRPQGKENNAGSSASAGVLREMGKSLSGRNMSSAQQAVMQMLMTQMMAGDAEASLATLDDVLASKGQADFVRPGDAVRSAAEVMADSRKAVLVVERGVLVGIFTPKDMLNRVLAKDLSPDETMVSDVMTPNPDSVLPELTVLDALHQMHEYKYLHLPVVTDGGRVVGLVDVMEIINATVGKE
ncbi:unnamed protein product, partial [Chrysoparadoxa australica]